LQIEVWDTGPGIPADQRRNIFSEFYRLGGSAGEQQAGLGLGLAIVERLSRLLDHPIELKSTVGKGSCFSVLVPHVSVRPEPGVALKPAAEASLNAPNGKVVVVIDDDRLVLEGMSGLFRSWGCRVVTGTSQSAALAGLMEYDRLPDVIISDYRLGDGRTGIEVIADMRRTLASPVPAFLVSGDTDPVALQEARANGLMLLHKPVDPMALRATFTQLVRKRFFK
jgi:CheY-like chemotaxis protein